MINFFNITEQHVKIALYYSSLIYTSWKTNWWTIFWITSKSELFIEIYHLCLKDYLIILIKHTIFRFDKLSDLVVYDRVSVGLRFFISYILSNYNREFKVNIRLNVDQLWTVLISISKILYIANWAEREAMDMYGIKFYGHDDLRRILGDYGLWGFPGRRCYPLIGLYIYMYSLNFLRVFRVRGIFTDFWSVYFQKKIEQS